MADKRPTTTPAAQGKHVAVIAPEAQGKHAATKRSKQGSVADKRINPSFLEHIKVTSFGKFANLIVGPFSPGLNVVYGPNESGKTTVTELVRGVLFGWLQNRKNTNSYLPEGSKRAGSLFFKDLATKETTELNGPDSPDEFHIRADIDKDTFATMFALTSDELNQLDRHSEVTAHLLTAGAGTSASPAHALEAIEARLKAALSKSANEPNSIANLRARQDELRQQVQAGMAEAEHYREQEQALKDLVPRKETLLENQKALNTEIEALKANVAQLRDLDEQAAEAQAKLEQATQEWKINAAGTNSAADPDLLALSARSEVQDAQLRDRLEDFEEQRRKLDQRVEQAKITAVKSQSEYEVLMEDRDVQADQRRARTQRLVQMALSIIIPALMALFGVYIVLASQDNLSLSYTILGSSMVLGALIIAAAGITMNLRPTKREEELNDQRKKCEWIMQQDRKAYEAAQAEVREHGQRVQSFLVAHHLGQAEGSLRRARALLDQAQHLRHESEKRDQNKRALRLQIDALEEAVRTAEAKRAQIVKGLGLPADADAAAIEELIARKEAERESTMQLAGETNRRHGELQQELEQAHYRTSFDQVKLEAEQVNTQLADAYQNLARLLLAQRSLEEAIAQWERKSQPEVYARASQLMQLMTNGAWQQVRMNAAGEIEVVDAIKTARPPHLLSLGTRQQLYLSLRIALLIVANNTGRSIPVLCDDILVNFDQKRREGAVSALMELARYRQVILFTCHTEVVNLVQRIAPDANVREL